MNRRARNRRGVAIIWMAMLTIVFIGLLGVACDTGLGVLVAHQLQGAADAAALAGAQVLKSTDHIAIRLAAVDVGAANSAASAPVQLALNEGNGAEGDIVLGRYNRALRMFTPSLEAPNAVQIRARRTDDSLNGPLSLIFGPSFGVDSINLSRSAVSINQGGTGAGMIALCDDCECAMKITGTADINLVGGPMQVNSADPCAICGNGSGSINSPGVNVVGGLCSTPNVDFPIDVWPDAPAVEDPLRFIPEPTWDPAADLGTINTSGTFGPGYYSGGMDLKDGTYTQDVTLLPGIYVVDGVGIDIKSDTVLLAEGVMLFIPPGTGAVDIAGTSSIHVTPPDPDLYSYPGVGTYEYLSIFQSRSNTNDSRIIGTGLLDLQGTLYFPSADLEVGGTGDGFGTQLIAHTIWIHGNGDITINYDGSFPALGNQVFLVE